MYPFHESQQRRGEPSLYSRIASARLCKVLERWISTMRMAVREWELPPRWISTSPAAPSRTSGVKHCRRACDMHARMTRVSRSLPVVEPVARRGVYALR